MLAVPMKNKGYFEYAKYGSIGISWVLTTSIYFYLGYKGGTYLDQRFDSAPIFLLVGLLGGMALSIKTLITNILELLGSKNAKVDGDEVEKESPRGMDREKSNKNPKEPR